MFSLTRSPLTRSPLTRSPFRAPLGRLTGRLLLALAIVVAVAGPPGPLPGASVQSASAQTDDHGHGVGRLVVADASAHTVTVLDPASGGRLATFGTPGKIGNVYPSSSGRWVFLVHTDDNRVTVLDSGLRLEAHGDHLDVAAGAPYVRGTVFPGRKPIDFWAGHGMATVHNDDDGTLAVFSDAGLEESLSPKMIRGAGTGHNNAVVLEDLVLLSLASEGTVTAYGLADGAPRAHFEGCPRTHGWTAPTTALAAAGCLDGVLVFTRSGGAVQAHKVAEPAGSPENARVSTLVSHRLSPLLVGNFGDGLAVVRPDATELQVIPLPTAPVRFAFDRRGERVVVLTADGRIQSVDPESGTVAWTADAVTPVDPSGAVPRPSLTVGEEAAFVSDPPRGRIVKVDLATGGSGGAPLNVGGTPTLLTLVTVEGVRH